MADEEQRQGQGSGDASGGGGSGGIGSGTSGSDAEQQTPGQSLDGPEDIVTDLREGDESGLERG